MSRRTRRMYLEFDVPPGRRRQTSLRTSFSVRESVVAAVDGDAFLECRWIG